MIRPVLVALAAGAVLAACADTPTTPPPPAPAVSAPAVLPAAAPPIVPGVVVTVTSVTDGDTFRVGDEKYRVLVMDSCEKGVTGWRDARDQARELLDDETVTVTSEPGVDLDRYGRHLVYVELPDGRDYAETMLAEPHTGVYDGTSDASDERMAAGRAADVDGRDCGASTTAATSSSSTPTTTTTTAPSMDDETSSDPGNDGYSPAGVGPCGDDGSGCEDIELGPYASSGEAQYAWGCAQGYITEGC